MDKNIQKQKHSKQLILKSIRFYQKYLSLDQSPFLKTLNISVCIHRPYCSEYTYQAIEKYGVFRGILKGSLRILRCNPFSKGGFDPLK